MSNKQINKLQNKGLFFKGDFEKSEAIELYIFNKTSKKHIATVNGKSRNMCLEKANNLFDRFEFVFSFNDQNQYKLKVIKNPFKLYIFHEKTKEHCNTILGKTKKDCWKIAGDLLNHDEFDTTFTPLFGRINGIEPGNTNCYLYA